MARPDFLAEVRSRFVTEDDCRRYLVECRWPVSKMCSRGLKRYETAWTMQQKLRRAMIRPERDREVLPPEHGHQPLLPAYLPVSLAVLRQFLQRVVGRDAILKNR